MTLEQQVVSLELAQKLKELGVKQDSYFGWSKGRFDQSDKSKWELADCIDTHASENVSAFTVAELGEMLPKVIRNHDLQFWFANQKARIGYMRDEEDGAHFMNSREDGMGNNVGTDANTEADARAKMLIYLLENNLIKVEDLK